MNNINFDIYSTFISILSLATAIFACYQTSRTIKLSNRAMVSMYLISSKKGTYIKIKNFGNFDALLLTFETDINVNKANTSDKLPFPLVGLKNIYLAPKTSKIALINNKYLNNNHWISVKYRDTLTNKLYTFRLELNTYREYALIVEEDFNLVDY